MQHELDTHNGRRLAGSRTRSHKIVRAALTTALIALWVAAPTEAASSAPGQMYAFGDNQWGQLGNPTHNMNHGENVPNPTPTLVILPGEVGSVNQAAAGGDHSLAVTSSGQLYAFGSNYFGQLGNKTNNLKEEANPVPMLVTLPGASGDTVEVGAGRYHSLALTSTGQLFAFGDNNWGQLGDATNTGESEAANPTPTLVGLPGATGGVMRVAAGAYHSLAVTSTGQLYSFGDNVWGQLGTAINDGSGPGPIPPNPTPGLVTLPDENGPVTQVAAGAWFSLAVTVTGQLYAFGENRFGQLGNSISNRTEEPNPTPSLVTLPGAAGRVVQVAAGFAHSLALTSTGQLYAFGENACGQLGKASNNRTEEPNPTPSLVALPGATGPIIRVAAGGSYSLALTSTGQLYAFGCNFFGELGTPPSKEKLAPHPTPQPVTVAGGTNLETVGTGAWSNHTVVVTADLVVSSNALSTGEIRQFYEAPMQGTGGVGAYRWTAAGLPQGLAIDQASGTIFGIPSASGTYAPTITLTDSDGIQAIAQPAVTITGPNDGPTPTTPEQMPPQRPENPTGPLELAQPPPPEVTPLSIQHVHQSSKRWREDNSLARISHGRRHTGTTFSFVLNEEATVSFDFFQISGTQHHICVDKGRYSAVHKRCEGAIWRGTLSFTGHDSANSISFASRISRSTKLEPGRYEVCVTAVNSAGQRTQPVSLRFTIAR